MIEISSVVSQSHSDPVLECRSLSVAYQRAGKWLTIVDQVDLHINPNETLGLAGESGSGKSTLAFAVADHLGRNGRVTGGSIIIDGENLKDMAPEKARRFLRERVAMIYQEPMSALNPAMRIVDQLAEIPVYHRNTSWSKARNQACDMLERVQVADIDRVAHSYPHELSGGQQQRVVIAMGLLARPKLLLLDEPTTALDASTEAGIMRLLRDVAAEYRMSMLLITHNLKLIRQNCQRTTIMYAGQTIETGSVVDVFSSPRHPYSRALFAASPKSSEDKTINTLKPIHGDAPDPAQRPNGCGFGPRCEIFSPGLCDVSPILMRKASPSQLVRCLRADEILVDVPELYVSRTPAPAERHILHISAVNKKYERSGILARMLKRNKQVVANHDINLDIWEGRTLAIVGKSGSGKSTLGKILMGIETADSGEVNYHGVNIGIIPLNRRDGTILSDLQMVFQNPAETLNPAQTVGFQLGRALQKLGGVKAKDLPEQISRLLAQVKLPSDIAFRKANTLSGGQKQRVAIARALAGSPRIIIADEPVSALDVSVQASIVELLLEIQRTNGNTLILITHDIALVRYIADEIAVMHQGSIVEYGNAQEVFASPQHHHTRELIADSI